MTLLVIVGVRVGVGVGVLRLLDLLLGRSLVLARLGRGSLVLVIGVLVIRVLDLLLGLVLGLALLAGVTRKETFDDVCGNSLGLLLRVFLVNLGLQILVVLHIEVQELLGQLVGLRHLDVRDVPVTRHKLIPDVLGNHDPHSSNDLHAETSHRVLTLTELDGDQLLERVHLKDETGEDGVSGQLTGLLGLCLEKIGNLTRESLEEFLLLTLGNLYTVLG